MPRISGIQIESFWDPNKACEPHTPVSSPAAPHCSLLGGLLRAGRPDVHNFRPVNFYKSHKASGGVHKFGTKILGMNRYIKRSAAPDGQTDEQHQEWLLARTSEQFANRHRTRTTHDSKNRRGLGAKSGFWAPCVLTDFSQESAGSYGC